MSTAPFPPPACLLQPPPLSLYIHIPWCVKRCPYCDFNAHVDTQFDTLVEPYLNALIADWQLERQRLAQHNQGLKPRPLVSVFIGGGTPSLMPGHFYERLLTHIANTIDFADNCELTLEANPSSSARNTFSAYRRAGFNRLSLGIQSFNDNALVHLGRAHNRTQALYAIDAAHAAEFAINIDLMHGLPQQSVAAGLQDLNQALNADVTHLSWYELTIEPNTPFYRRPPILPKEATIATLHAQGRQLLQASGLTHYEISAWSKPKAQSIHNHNYWLFGDYIGIGAGAHGKLTDSPNQRIIRTQKTRLPKDYLRQFTPPLLTPQPITPQPTLSVPPPKHEPRLINAADRRFEFMLNALRLLAGFDLHTYEARTGLHRQDIAGTLRQATKMGLITANQDWIQPTAQGMRFHNDLLRLFLPA